MSLPFFNENLASAMQRHADKLAQSLSAMGFSAKCNKLQAHVSFGRLAISVKVPKEKVLFRVVLEADCTSERESSSVYTALYVAGAERQLSVNSGRVAFNEPSSSLSVERLEHAVGQVASSSILRDKLERWVTP